MNESSTNSNAKLEYNFRLILYLVEHEKVPLSRFRAIGRISYESRLARANLLLFVT